MKHITIVAGARPNFMKIAPIIHEIIKQNKILTYSLVHTGQHYDKNMSGDFFEQLNIPHPDINLNAGGGTQSEQTASILIKFEKYLNDISTDLVLVVGDVNSTMACAITARKMNIRVAHVEAGIRSGDMSMPEEINRIVTDSISNYFFTTSKLANEKLYQLGFPKENVFFVGNTMIDTLLLNKSRFKKPSIWDILKLVKRNYIVITLHRPANVDEENNLRSLIHELVSNSKGIKIIFPAHPRTKSKLDKLGVDHQNLHVVDPMSYLEFNYLVENSLAVFTDSGGITEETTVMKIPTFTLRDNTERPETISMGTNLLIGTNPLNIGPAMKNLFNMKPKNTKIPELWDGKTSERIINKLIQVL